MVVAGEEGHHHEALHGGGKVAPDHLAELVGLALEREGLALDLLVVLELHLEQLHHLDRRPGRAGDGDAGVVVGREHLLDAPAGDGVSRGGATVARHHHAARVADGDHGRAVGDLERRTARSLLEAGTGEVVGRDAAQEVDEGRARVEPGREGGKGRLDHAASLYGDLLSTDRSRR